MTIFAVGALPILVADIHPQAEDLGCSTPNALGEMFGEQVLKRQCGLVHEVAEFVPISWATLRSRNNSDGGLEPVISADWFIPTVDHCCAALFSE